MKKYRFKTVDLGLGNVHESTSLQHIFADEFVLQVAGTWLEKSLDSISIHWYPPIAALFIVPFSMVRVMKYMVPFSSIANICLMAGALSIVCYMFFIDDISEILSPSEKPVYVVWPWSEWTLFAGSALFSMEGVGMLLHIENVMENPLELAGPPSYTLHVSMLVTILANIFMGLFGYIKYGTKCKGNISLNLPLGYV
ncbi:Amino acid transporter, transmembrane domain [Cinara cedri]|uniref:Amino acid transporter, transmembrane domain n=1 Tax=Cinara cedri TaxID=506608 RepID=A0A5E4N567_9HEMI|nr:Amino acid transporter, transmembrane domain [Cinara cedri]